MRNKLQRAWDHTSATTTRADVMRWAMLILLGLLAVPLYRQFPVASVARYAQTLTFGWYEAGMTALYLAAVWLVWRASPTDSRLVQRIELGVILGIGILLRAQVVGDPPGLSHDIFRYVWDAHLLTHGVSPYVHTPLDPTVAHLRDQVVWPQLDWRDAPTIYPPGAQGLFVLVGLFAPLNVLALKGVITLCDLGAALLTILLLRQHGQDIRRVILYWWSPIPIIEFAYNGHIDALAIVFTLLAVYFAYGGRASPPDPLSNWSADANGEGEKTGHRCGSSLGEAGLAPTHNLAGLAPTHNLAGLAPTRSVAERPSKAPLHRNGEGLGWGHPDHPEMLTPPLHSQMGRGWDVTRFLVGVCLGLATLTKIYPLLFVAAVARPRDRALYVGLVGTIAVGYLPVLLVGLGGGGFLGTYFRQRFVDQGILQKYLGLAVIRLGGTPVVLTALQILLIGALCGLVLWWRWRVGGVSPVVGILAVSVIWLAFSPHILPWYLAALLPLLALYLRLPGAGARPDLAEQYPTLAQGLWLFVLLMPFSYVIFAPGFNPDLYQLFFFVPAVVAAWPLLTARGRAASVRFFRQLRPAPIVASGLTAHSEE